MCYVEGTQWVSKAVYLAADFWKVKGKVIMTQGGRGTMMFIIVRKKNNKDPGKIFCGVVRHGQEDTEIVSHVTSRVRPKDAENGLRRSQKGARYATVETFFSFKFCLN